MLVLDRSALEARDPSLRSGWHKKASGLTCRSERKLL